MSTAIDLERNTGLPSLGIHTFKVTRFKEEVGPSGHPYIMFSCTCIDQGEDRGKEVIHMVSLSPQARFKVDEFLDAIQAAKKGRATPEQFVGKVFRATVELDTWEGRDRAVLTKLIPGGGEQLPGMEQPSIEASSQEVAYDYTDEEKEGLPEDVKGSKPPF